MAAVWRKRTREERKLRRALSSKKKLLGRKNAAVKENAENNCRSE